MAKDDAEEPVTEDDDLDHLDFDELHMPLDYDELDPPVREVVRVLREDLHVDTFNSCGGHENGGMAAPGSWYVQMYDDHYSDRGYYGFTVLASVVSENEDVQLRAEARKPPPLRAYEGEGAIPFDPELMFTLEPSTGFRTPHAKVTADTFAEEIRKAVGELYG